MSPSTDPALYANLVATICAVGIAIDSLEILYSREEYGPRGILSWDILRLDSRFALTGTSGLVLGFLLAYPGFLILISVQLLFAVAIVSQAAQPLLPVLVSGILITRLLANLRNAHGGLDGSDQMQTIVFFALTLLYFTPDMDMKAIALWFTAAQSILSYLAAGFAKLISPTWRRGDALVGIMATDHYGNRRIADILQNHRPIAFFVCWLVILFECFAPVLVFAGTTPCLVFIGFGLLFHLMIAVVMGLNTFVWSFGGAYPALLFLASSFER